MLKLRQASPLTIGFLGLVLLQIAGCGSSGQTDTKVVDPPSKQDASTEPRPGLDAGDGDGGVGDAGDAAITPGDCTPTIETQPLVDSPHIPVCSPVTYAHNPPASGPHYPNWAAYGEYDFALPRGYWLHNVEHGSVVLAYNCPQGCADDVARARAWMQNMLADPYCGAQGGEKRVLLLPDPLLDVTWAAIAWGVTLKASCFDAETFQAFFTSNAGKGPENVCSSGVDFRAQRPPANCGSL
jgi:hypothetical protein